MELPGRPITDVRTARQAIYDAALQSLRSMPPLQNKRHRLVLSDIDFVDPEHDDYAAEREALLAGSTLGRRVRGTWKLYDLRDGSLVDKRRQTLLTVPTLTDQGTLILHGNRYVVASQLRMRPGVYTRVKENGEVETQVNLMSGEGVSHRYYLDPSKGTFHIELRQAKLPLLPLLKVLGAKDEDIRRVWGDDLWQANRHFDTPQHVRKLAQRFVRGWREGDPAEALRAEFARTRLDPRVVQMTLGRPYTTVDAQAILDATRRLLAVNRGEEEPDDRDNLAYQRILGPEDLMTERLKRGISARLRRAFWLSSLKSSLKPMPAGVLQEAIEEAVTKGGLGVTPEESNPSDSLDRQSRLTRLGEGGIGDRMAIPDESRAVNPSYLGFIDPVRTPESETLGVEIFFSSQVRKGPNGDIYAPFIDVRTGRTKYLSPADLVGKNVAFSAAQLKDPWVFVRRDRELIPVRRHEVDYAVPHFEQAFSPLAHFVPIKSAIHAQRMAMGSRMTTQALPLVQTEAPWVQTGIPGVKDRSYEEELGPALGALRAKGKGVVLQVSPGKIVVRYGREEHTHPLYHHFPFARQTFQHQIPLVKPGDKVEEGQVLARSLYTDASGTAALGINARVGMIPWKGWNYEDAIVISESMAKRLSSIHMQQEGLDKQADHVLSQKVHRGIFGGRFTPEQYAMLDENGVIKEGSVVRQGDPLILAVLPRDTGQQRVHRKGERSWLDHSVTWDYEDPGEVVGVYHGPHRVRVLIKSISPAKVGDKLSGRHGNKGVISRIIPDEQMPRDEEGRPLEVLYNPLGVISRGNPAGPALELALAKVAAKRGKPFKLVDFEDEEDWLAFTRKVLKEHGLEDVLETVTDPETGKKIPGVAVGNMYLYKLHHQAEGKRQARSLGAYSALGEPARGGEEGSKRISLMEVNALLSSGATAVLRDAGSIRGQRNDQYWLDFLRGVTPAKPDIPLVYQQFINSLRGAGIQVVESGKQLHLMALTDKDVDALAGTREIQSSDTVRFDLDLTPVEGGLFDPRLTGGHNGKRWSAIRLAVPLPNPAFIDPIRRLLDLTENELDQVIGGRKELDGKTGPQAVASALDRINVPRMIAALRQEIKTASRTRRDQALRKLGYLLAAQRAGQHPREWIWKRVPVLPPAFRPVSRLSDTEIPIVADANYLYRDLFEANRNLAELQGKVADVRKETETLWGALKAVAGLGDPVQATSQERQVRGFLRSIVGDAPKYSHFQRRLIGSNLDLTGRAVVTPDPDLDMDTVAIPEEGAWELYKNFIIRRLRRAGVPVATGMQMVEMRHPEARKALLEEMRVRPVLVNRAPTLHRFGIMAFWPQLSPDNTVHVSPLVTKGFGMDFDGDAVNYHVPVDEEAVQEAIRLMLPSRNLVSPADFVSPAQILQHEYIGGLYLMSRPQGDRVRVFRSLHDAREAYQRGELRLNEPIRILQSG